MSFELLSNLHFFMKKLLIGFLSVLTIFSQGWFSPIKAAPEYDSQWVGQSPHITLVAGQEQEVWVEFKNDGLGMWYKNGLNPVHLGTVGPQDRVSQFYDQNSWLRNNRIEMSQEKVGPGDIARFVFTIKAPMTAGVYREYFRPVAEDKTWMRDQGVYWEWRVIAGNGFEEMCVSKDSGTQSVSDSGCSLPEPWMYDSRWSTQSPYVKMYPGQKAEAWVEFVNDGQASWNKSGDFAVHLGTANPLDRKSLFSNTSWLSNNRIVMEQDKVDPGQKARFTFQLTAPSQKGVYQEYFRPVIENVTWLKDEGVFWTIEVVEQNQIDQSEDNVNNNDITNDNTDDSDLVPKDYAAKLVKKTGEVYFSTDDNNEIELTVSYKNIGQKTWNRDGQDMVQLGTILPNDRNCGFYTNDWLNTHRIAMKQTKVAPGETADFTFRVAKNKVEAGTHKENFGLVFNDSNWLAGTEVFWEMVVGKSTGWVEVTADGSFDVVEGSSGKILATLSSGQIARIKYLGGKYQVKYGDEDLMASDYIRLEGGKDRVMTVLSYADRKSWDSSINDNQFRDTIEVRYSPTSQALWVINELSMEGYVAGVAETSDSSPMEFIKALAIAERTYAVSLVNNGGKHPQDFVDVYNSVNGNGDDQVYRGYSFEMRNKDVQAGVKATKGMVVKYKGKVAITPYYSHADGRTRSWEEVWGSKNYPYCVSVPDPYTEGMSLYGHGVGMSALGAMKFAEKENKTYDWILKYYYTGIDISQYDTDSMRVRVGINKI